MAVMNPNENLELQLCRLMTRHERTLLRTCYVILQDRQLAEKTVRKI